MLQKKKTTDMIVAIALFIASLLTFVSLFGNIVESKIGSVTLEGLDFIDLIKNGPKTISEGFNGNSDYSQLASGIIALLDMIFYFSGLLFFLIFGIMGVINLVRFLQGKQELKTNYLLRAVLLKTAFDLFTFFISYGSITNISSGMSMSNVLGWGSILAIVSSFIVLIAYSFRYIYIAYLLKKDIYIPIMMCLGVLLILIASIVGCHNQLQLNDLDSGLASKTNGLELTITVMALNAKGYDMNTEMYMCEYGGILMLSAPVLSIVVIDFFKVSKKKKDFIMIIDGIVPIIMTTIGVILVTSSSTQAGFSAFQVGAGLITSLVLSGVATILFVVCFVTHKNKNITLKPEELMEEVGGHQEETSSYSESSGSSSDDDDINVIL